MRRILIAWVGMADLRAPTESDTNGLGPIAQALTQREFEAAILLSDLDPRKVSAYLTWLKPQTNTSIEVVPRKLRSPTDFGDIYEAARDVVAQAIGADSPPPLLTFHLSPGTPAMAPVWIIIAKTRFPAELIESSKEHGVRTASVPFDISADFIPDLLRDQDERLKAASAAAPAEAPEFSDIIHRGKAMTRLIDRARRVAYRNVPVIIEGESGTGKEMLARAIHRASPRAAGPFIAINCGAIPASLIESELFGHDKGAFTGAEKARVGLFESTDGGTVFLDELGELPLAAQVKLLRVLQEGEVLRVGATKPKRISVRMIAATHRDLVQEVAAGRFREDLFFRLAVAILKVPPLRERESDLGLLIDHLLLQVNQGAAGEPRYEQKKLSAGAKNLLRSHPWPGNVRELLNTLHRVAIWTDGPTIRADDVREALLPAISGNDNVLGRPLGDGFDIRALLREVQQHYLDRAMAESGNKKAKAADLLGLPNYQTLNNWLKKQEAE